MLECRDEQQELVTISARMFHDVDEADIELRAQRLADWKEIQSQYDRVNNALPERYRQHLQDRGYGEGFSREERRR